MIAVKFLITALKIPVLSSFSVFLSIGIIVFLYIATKKFRDAQTDQSMTYNQAFGYIFRVYIYGSVIGSLVMLFYALLNADFLGVMLNDTLMIYEKMNINIDDKTYDILNAVFKPAPYALFNIFGSALVAAFWSLILALFLKKEKSIFE
jgi:hypothetical protein